MPTSQKFNKIKDDSDFHIVTLTNRKGEPIQLNSQDIEKLLARTEHYIQLNIANQTKQNQQQYTATPTQSSELSSQLLSRFGLKNPQDIVAFLQSPAGESTRSKIGEDLAEIAALKEQQRIDLRDQEIRRQRRIAFILLFLAKKKEAKAHLNEQIQEQINQQNQKIQKTQSKTSSTLQDTAVSELLKENQIKIDNIDTNIRSIDQDLENLAQKVIELDKAHEIYQDKMLVIEDNLNQDLLKLDTTKLKINHLENKITQHKIELDKVAMMEIPDSPEEQQELRKNLELLSSEIGLYNDHIEVLKGNKLYLDSLGNEVEFASSEMGFVVPKTLANELNQQQKHFVEDDGKYYLIQNGQNIEDLSTEEKAIAHREAKTHKPEQLAVVKVLKSTNVQLEKQDISVQSAILEADKANQNTEKMQLLNERQQLLTNTPKPTLTPNQSAKSKSTENAASSYRTILSAIKQNPSKAAVLALQESLQDAAKTLDEPELTQGLATLKPGQPIPDEVMKNLNRLPDANLTSLTRSLQDKIPTLETTLNQYQKIAGTPKSDKLDSVPADKAYKNDPSL